MGLSSNRWQNGHRSARVPGPTGVDYASITFVSALAAEQERRLGVVTVTEPLMMGPGRDYSVEAYERDLGAVHGPTTEAMQVLVEEVRDASPELTVSGQTVQATRPRCSVR